MPAKPKAIDYDKLAAESGVNYDLLAKEAGAIGMERPTAPAPTITGPALGPAQTSADTAGGALRQILSSTGEMFGAKPTIRQSIPSVLGQNIGGPAQFLATALTNPRELLTGLAGIPGAVKQGVGGLLSDISSGDPYRVGGATGQALGTYLATAPGQAGGLIRSVAEGLPAVRSRAVYEAALAKPAPLEAVATTQREILGPQVKALKTAQRNVAAGIGTRTDVTTAIRTAFADEIAQAVARKDTGLATKLGDIMHDRIVDVTKKYGSQGLNPGEILTEREGLSKTTKFAANDPVIPSLNRAQTNLYRELNGILDNVAPEVRGYDEPLGRMSRQDIRLRGQQRAAKASTPTNYFQAFARANPRATAAIEVAKKAALPVAGAGLGAELLHRYFEDR